MKPSKTIAQTTFAERLGRALGRTWQAALRLDRKAQGALAAHGMNAALATGILWAVRIALLGLALYGAFWAALLLVAVFVVGQIGQRSAEIFPVEKGQWRDDSEGYGYYENGIRTDFGPLFEDDLTT
jgi:hypothetical protein